MTSNSDEAVTYLALLPIREGLFLETVSVTQGLWKRRERALLGSKGSLAEPIVIEIRFPSKRNAVLEKAVGPPLEAAAEINKLELEKLKFDSRDTTAAFLMLGTFREGQLPDLKGRDTRYTLGHGRRCEFHNWIIRRRTDARRSLLIHSVNTSIGKIRISGERHNVSYRCSKPQTPPQSPHSSISFIGLSLASRSTSQSGTKHYSAFCLAIITQSELPKDHRV